MHQLPNALSVLRLASVPVLALLAWLGHAEAFLVLFVASLLTDIVDGFLARRLDVASEFGAKLDSYGDLALCASLPVCAWWLHPDLLRSESSFLAAAVGALVVPIALGLIKFRRLTSYHTYGAKLTAWVMGMAVVLMLAGGPTWPFHLATALLILEALEEVAITLVLPRWQANVPTLLHALRRDASTASSA